MLKTIASTLVLLAIAGCPHVALAQHTPTADRLFAQNCSKCHDSKESGNRAPDRRALSQMTPEAIYAALTTGPMAPNAASLDDAQKRSIAEMLAGRPLGNEASTEASAMKNRCADEPLGEPFKGPMWNGWGADVTNGHYQPMAA